ncbi:MAG TPA: hypothetical protein VFM54_20870, partial [Micromonosporaceae bacterium]|nr:hypothetical protein [Micromonosporaceae bacterium]
VAQRRADVEREIVDRRTEAAQKIAALHAQAQHHCAEVRRRGDEQAAAHQQQLAVVQREIQAHRQRLAQLQAELDAAEQRLAQARQEHATVEHEVTQMRHDLREVSQDLITERNRLAEVRQAAEAAEQHAKEVRARVRREAKRVAELAAAAVMAAATGGADTGEYPKVMARPAADRPVEPPAGAVVPGGPGMPTAGSGYASQDTGDAVPAAQQEPQPGELALAGDAE